jgi:hypothetical protein
MAVGMWREQGAAEALVRPLRQSVGGTEIDTAELRMSLSLGASGALLASASASLTVSSSSSTSVSPRLSTSGVRASGNEVLLSKIRTGRHHPHKVVVLDGATVTELKGEMSFRLECNGWVGVLSCDSVPATAKVPISLHTTHTTHTTRTIAHAHTRRNLKHAGAV